MPVCVKNALFAAIFLIPQATEYIIGEKMGFLDKILSREKTEEKKPEAAILAEESEPKVCIPEARKKIIENEAIQQKQEEKKQELLEQKKEEELPWFTDEKPRFMVEGIFAVIDTLMLKGRVASGKIQKGMVLAVAKKKFKIKDLQFEGRSVPHLLQGQTGAIFFNKAKGLTFKAGKMLEFKQK